MNGASQRCSIVATKVKYKKKKYQMANPSIPCTGSPDISTLSYAVFYDISGAVPTITLTNYSTLIHPLLLTWWYVIATPSGTPIHTGSLATPDVPVGQTWATLTIPANSWPLPFGNAPCGQVEFSNNVPYTCTLFVADSSNNGFNLAILQTITRPNGNTENSCGNFGVAAVDIDVTCGTGLVLCSDSTNFTYQQILIPSAQNNNWILVYPPDVNGNQPTNGTTTNTPYVNFPVTYSGSGYMLYLLDYCTYNMGNGASIKVQYKAINPQTGSPGLSFAVLCNINFCQLQCQITTFYELSKKKCGTVDDPALDGKLTRMNMLLSQAIIGVMQPLCGIDVPLIIKEIQRIGDLDPNCNCGCGEAGINFSNAIGPISPGGCCPVSVPIVNVTSSPLTSCIDTIWPVQVYNPTYTTITGIAYDIPSLIYLLNITSSWSAYGVAFSEGSCQVGFFPATPGNAIPSVHIANAGTSTACVGNTQIYTVNIVDVCLLTATITPSSFPLNVFVDFGLGAGPIYIGNVANETAMLAALNTTPSKPPTVTFLPTAASTPGTIVINNSSCSSYSTPIVVTCDAGSSSFLAIGAAHLQELTSPAVINGGVVAYGMHSNSLAGEFPGLSSANIQWHTVKIGTHLMVTESNTGRVYCFDINNPLYPVLVKTVQLNAVVGSCFTGLPTSLGINGTVLSFYSLYFPTDYNIMTLSNMYVVEGITGCIWNINMDPSTTTGVIASFHDNRFLGKCPRVMLNISLGGAPTPHIIFTQDGSLEQNAGLVSGVLAGDIVVLDLNTFSGSGITVMTTTIPVNTQQIWAACYDGANTIWFMGQGGALAKGFISPSSSVFSFVAPTYATGINLALRSNMSFFQSTLYVTSLNGSIFSGGSTVARIDISALPSVPVTVFSSVPGNGAASKHAHNVLPLGNCLVLVTTEGGEPSGAEGAILVYRTNGVFLMSCLWNNGQSVYNVVVIGGITVYTPNGLM
jgi:hypothetical protein